ncbi:MAG: hypothetical protein CMN29_34145 [Sandaracinus sp.]|nr:hypothetical protein [Sandaracinus sp.]HJK90712.1 hypothetical protein [Polyangiaceae bacterium LLY-WYZ-15_(1-7)]HJL49317.1 hypothetical protein [Polyangiaceae bacterium LLY-WYZ-15_(1-7)]
MSARAPLLSLALLGLLASCGDDAPADVAGSYTVTVTNGDNGCMVDGWDEGESTANIPLTVTQSDASAVAEVGGLTGTFLSGWIGSNRFQGAVSGRTLDLVLVGTREGSIPGCTYTVDAALEATVDGSFLDGTVTYTPRTDGAAGCGLLDACANVQTLVGTRPPAE